MVFPSGDNYNIASMAAAAADFCVRFIYFSLFPPPSSPTVGRSYSFVVFNRIEKTSFLPPPSACFLHYTIYNIEAGRYGYERATTTTIIIIIRLLQQIVCVRVFTLSCSSSPSSFPT